MPIVERMPIDSTPTGGFAYVLYFEAGNCLFLGMGHESRNGLQLAHVPGPQVHAVYCHEVADNIEANGILLPTARLAAFFEEQEQFPIGANGLNPQQAKWFADLIRKVHDRIWGHPLDWEPTFVDFADGRFVWVAYGEDVGKIRVGIGFFNDSQERILGDACYMIPLHYVAEFVTEAFMRPVGMYYFAKPPRWPAGWDTTTDDVQTRRVMREVLKLADKVWPGEVEKHVSRKLTPEEIAQMHASPAHTLRREATTSAD